MKRFIQVSIFLFFSFALQAQDNDNKKVSLTTVDGTQIVGTIIEQTSEKILISTELLGQVEIFTKDIKEINYGNNDDSKEKVDYHSSTRYLVSPNGYMLKKGQSYYENIGVFFNSFSFGVSDHFNISVGGEIASILFGSQFPIIYVSPKAGIPFGDGKGSWSVGTTFFTSPSDNFGGFGFLNTSVTLGNRSHNVSLGTGIGYSFSDGFGDGIVPIMVGGVTRLGPKLSLVSDNFIIFIEDSSDATAVLSLGLRMHLKNGGAINASLWRPTEDLDSLVALPFVSATIPLGK